ncbi:MAG: Rap1a/Tai family immunity protein [Pseudomonadota bacterium]|nr:Rap1a/Tai family immunity protein [Pseudomonadota bacterium]
MRTRVLGTSTTVSGDSSRRSAMMLNLRLLALGMFCFCFVHVADAAWSGTELLEICELALHESDDLTEQDIVEETACCSCYVDAISDTSAYYLQNVITPLMEGSSISSRKLKKSGWPSMEEFQKTVKLHCPKSSGALHRSRRTDVVRGFLRAHPERLAESATILVLDALSDAFPCNDLPSIREVDPGEQSIAPTRIIDIDPRMPRDREPVGETKSIEADAPPIPLRRSIEEIPEAVTSPSKGSLDSRGAWLALREAMTEDEVRALLGKPVRIEIQSRHNRSPRTHWYYSDNQEKARVTFREGRVRRLRDWRKVWLVQSWDEPTE